MRYGIFTALVLLLSLTSFALETVAERMKFSKGVVAKLEENLEKYCGKRYQFDINWKELKLVKDVRGIDHCAGITARALMGLCRDHKKEITDNIETLIVRGTKDRREAMSAKFASKKVTCLYNFHESESESSYYPKEYELRDLLKNKIYKGEFTLAQFEWQIKAKDKVFRSELKIEKKCECRKSMEIQWKGIDHKNDARYVDQCIYGVSNSLTNICKDFKKEICSGIKSIKIQGVKGKEKKVIEPSLKSGVLTCRFRIAGESRYNARENTVTAERIQAVIEDSL